MAQQILSTCPVCLDVMNDPIYISCGHHCCKTCINGCWDEKDPSGVYRCPQCSKPVTPKPEEKKLKIELQAVSPAYLYAGPGDVECDSCTGRKRKAVNSCLVCLVSYCEDHLQPHYQSPAFKKHKLVEACAELHEKICSKHDKLIDIYCLTDQKFLCYLCMMDDHKDHQTVSIEKERTDKQNELKNKQINFQQRIRRRKGMVHQLKQTMDSIKRRSQAAVDDSERVFTELISLMEKKRSEVTKLIRAQEKAELSRTKGHLIRLQQEITDLKRRISEMEELSDTQDHIHFLKNYQPLFVFPGCKKSSSITVDQPLSFDDLRKSLSEVKKQVKEICVKEFNKIHPLTVKVMSPLKTKKREEFLQYFQYLTLDPNTAHRQLILTEENRMVTRSKVDQHYCEHPERFHSCSQVLCKEILQGRCYWEVEWNGMGVDISVSYKDISRKGETEESSFGCNNQSWSLHCYSSSLSFWHNNIKTDLGTPPAFKIGVYVDHSAGTLSFYSISKTIRLLHSVRTIFTQPLYAGFKVCYFYTTMRLCDAK